MIYAFLYGFGTGILFSLMLGTVFFSLIQNSIDNGYRSGVLIASGVILADLIFIFFALFGSWFVPPIPHSDFIVSLLGFALLFALGLVSLIKKKPQLVYPKTKTGNIIYFIVNGFLLNSLNPVNFFIWVAIVAKLNQEALTANEILVFFGGCLSAIFLTEVGISVGASALKRYFTPKVMLYINRVSGLVFIGFSLKLLYDAFSIYYW